MIRIACNILFVSGLLTLSISSCQKEDPVTTQEEENQPPTEQHNSISKVFGFDDQRRYAYCPSIIRDGEKRHIWFCGTESEGQFIDHIYYIREDLPVSPGTIRTALAPGSSGEWDDQHVCDPSVIKGDFGFNDVKYQYAMFYLGTRSDRYFNEIGVAFSQAPDAEHWVKYPRALIPKTWNGEEDQLFGNGSKAWGVGQPSAISLDEKGKVLLTYTIGDRDGTRVVAREVDLSEMDELKMTEPRAVSISGLSKADHTTQNVILSNADFACDRDKKIIYMSAPVRPNPASYPGFISAEVDLYSISYQDFMGYTGTWKLIQRIGKKESGFARNHNSGIGRDAYGYIPDLKEGELYFTVGKEEPEVQRTPDKFAEWTYHIYKCSDILLQE